MEIFLEKIHQLMPVLGADALLPIGSAPEARAKRQILICEIKGLKATGYQTPTGFVVLKGSQAVLKERASAHQYLYTLASRRKLIEDGTLVENDGNPTCHAEPALMLRVPCTISFAEESSAARFSGRIPIERISSSGRRRSWVPPKPLVTPGPCCFYALWIGLLLNPEP